MERSFRILVADDDPDTLLLVTSVLKRSGYDVFETGTGKGCLEAVYTHHPDIVLLDLVLPDIKGSTVCRKIKSDPRLQDAFVILMSGIEVSSESQAKGLKIGADGYIVKPISNRELAARVKAAERIKRAEDDLREKVSQNEKLISELQEALAEVKTLKGYIPICASCKKIRDDEGYWSQLEAYIGKHTDAAFTHSFCPDCAKEFRAGKRSHRKAISTSPGQ